MFECFFLCGIVEHEEAIKSLQQREQQAIKREEQAIEREEQAIEREEQAIRDKNLIERRYKALEEENSQLKLILEKSEFI